MPKPATYPITYEDCKSIEIKLLSKNKYLLPNQLNRSTIRWHINEEITGRIKIEVNTLTNNPYMELIYKLNEEIIQYKVQLISEKSNLGIGNVWYFICPFTNRKCKKLYLVNKYFAYRNYYKSIYYENQLLSKSNRKSIGLFRKIDLINNAMEVIDSKHFKRYYNNVKTKRLVKLRNIINQEIDINYFNDMKLML